ncbi:MAG: CoA-binding protein [Armatimonadetes bacterium CG_4_10_14_3_um_filter_66_18]|nr:CoA-binding protein [Armatimonadota bacterium]OIP06646.1 MAG: CoA-binding protein [Armatimonadetes bacterium CG2_30_66_41]PIU88830.1 MAG: CoA-binding protein [Armatimonadetes bacterium CG06_land_8_20_14_3_00_66_21]PIX49217.1 MAG: CoA-binding protein [Armatimonadetes bacterium CG_4_8_14_3_um_filter_66_20]PIY52794.1 MAG: CoA-binding protein [Armatimonadetes bacterium CG_4_10_14_3_um_filter_66_18]PIZ34476.1 MAG: CoA-binding protein [Armatimonadetes bacterium CG_4_10_14_0_8_um_filter_66_14]PJB
MPDSIAIIGASTDRSKYGNKAVRAWRQQGWTVYPIHPTAQEVEGLPAYASVGDVPYPIDKASFYVPPRIGLKALEGVAEKGIKEVYLNPGAESEDLIARCYELGVTPIVACSILAVGAHPAEY